MELYSPKCFVFERSGGGGSDDCSVGFEMGTSMATPLAAGSAALVRQYFTDGFYPSGIKTAADAFLPSAPLVKAVMMGAPAGTTEALRPQTYDLGPKT